LPLISLVQEPGRFRDAEPYKKTPKKRSVLSRDAEPYGKSTVKSLGLFWDAEDYQERIGIVPGR
jgi:hypothetical protein